MTRTKKMIICAFFAAIITLTAPFAVVIGVVPVTLVMFSLALTAFVAGSRLGAAATGIYIIIGIIGLPVFSNFQGGIGALFSPTGGFIFSYVFVVMILGQCVKVKNKWLIALLWCAALVVCYFFGTMWYMLLTKSTLVTALGLCVVPFVPFDILKLILAYAVGKSVRKILVT